MASQIGLIEAAIKTAVETTSITTCFLSFDEGTAGKLVKPYARLLITDTGEAKDDMNGYRDVWYTLDIIVSATNIEIARVAMDELRILFDLPSLRYSLNAATMRVIQINYEGEAQPNVRKGPNVEAMMNWRMRVRYYYAQ